MHWLRGREQLKKSLVPPDQELLRGLIQRNGNEDAMAELYQRHGGLVYRFSLRLIQDEAAAEEVTQDVFLQLLAHSGRFDPARASLATWLCGIARRLVWKQLKIRQRNLALSPDEESNEIPSQDDDPFITVARSQAVLAVEQGLAELPPDLRAVVVLCEFEEMSYQEAADILGIPVGTVRSRLHRAKHRLAQLLTAGSAKTHLEECS